MSNWKRKLIKKWHDAKIPLHYSEAQPNKQLRAINLLFPTCPAQMPTIRQTTLFKGVIQWQSSHLRYECQSTLFELFQITSSALHISLTINLFALPNISSINKSAAASSTGRSSTSNRLNARYPNCAPRQNKHCTQRRIYFSSSFQQTYGTKYGPALSKSISQICFLLHHLKITSLANYTEQNAKQIFSAPIQMTCLPPHTSHSKKKTCASFIAVSSGKLLTEDNFEITHPDCAHDKHYSNRTVNHFKGIKTGINNFLPSMYTGTWPMIYATSDVIQIFPLQPLHTFVINFPKTTMFWIPIIFPSPELLRTWTKTLFTRKLLLLAIRKNFSAHGKVHQVN